MKWKIIAVALVLTAIAPQTATQFATDTVHAAVGVLTNMLPDDTKATRGE